MIELLDFFGAKHTDNSKGNGVWFEELIDRNVNRETAGLPYFLSLVENLGHNLGQLVASLTKILSCRSIRGDCNGSTVSVIARKVDISGSNHNTVYPYTGVGIHLP